MKTMNTLTSALRLTRLSRLTRFSLALTALGFATDLYAYRLPSNTTFELEAGSFDLGCALEADGFTLGAAATLAGSGTVAAPATVAGTLAPDGTLRFGSTLTFAEGAALVSRVTANESLDSLAVAGAVSGSAQVVLSQDPGAIPVGQTLIAGGASSVYDGVSAPGNAWQLAASGNNLLVTDLLGDTDSEGHLADRHVHACSHRPCRHPAGEQQHGRGRR